VQPQWRTRVTQLQDSCALVYEHLRVSRARHGPAARVRRQHFLGVVAAFRRAPAAAALPRTFAALLGLLRPPPAGARRSPLLALLAAAAVPRGWADADEWPQARPARPGRLRPEHCSGTHPGAART